jgi:hypothetical protein
MQPNDAGALTIFEMTPHGVANLLMQTLDRVGLGKDRSSKRARSQAALRRILNNEDQLVHGFIAFRRRISQNDRSTSNRLGNLYSAQVHATGTH